MHWTNWISTIKTVIEWIPVNNRKRKKVKKKKNVLKNSNVKINKFHSTIN